MTDLEWTDEPPEEEGWFWLDDGEMPPTPRPVRVEYSMIDEGLVVDDPNEGTGVYRSFDEYPDARWAGPIPRPSLNQNQ